MVEQSKGEAQGFLSYKEKLQGRHACLGGKPMKMPRTDDRCVCCFLGMRFDLCDGSCLRKLIGQPKTLMLPIRGLRPNAMKNGVVGLFLLSSRPLGHNLLRMCAACRHEWRRRNCCRRQQLAKLTPPQPLPGVLWTSHSSEQRRTRASSRSSF